MNSLYTAIIHLRPPHAASAYSLREPILQAIRGVGDVRYEPAESLVTVQFDGAMTGLAEIVRVIEDCGPAVAGVAQRRAG